MNTLLILGILCILFAAGLALAVILAANYLGLLPALMGGLILALVPSRKRPP